MNDFKSKIGYPNPLATFEEKLSKDYGLKISKLIGSDWFGGGLISASSNSEFMIRRDYVHKNRLFVRGEQDIAEYKKKETHGQDDLTMLNLDWSNVNIVEKFCRLVANGMSSDNYKLDIRSTDQITANLKKEKRLLHKKNMAAKPLVNKIKEELGVDLTPPGFVPEDMEELELYEELEDRPKIEIAEEILINFIKETNNWDFIERQTNWDEVVLGLLGVRVYIDKNDGIKLSYVDPENYIHSYINRNDFEDKYYEGVVETITLSDLKRESNGEISNVDLRSIAEKYGNLSTNAFRNDYSSCDMELLLDYKVDVLRFAFKTSKTILFKQKLKDGKVVKVSRKSDDFVLPNNIADASSISKTLDTWLEGNYIIGSDFLYGYKECENLARDEMNKAMSPFVFVATDIYKNRPKSFLDKIIPIANELQGIHLKLQQLRKKLRPDTIKINIDQLAELEDGKGGVKKDVWQTALSILKIEGVIFEKTIHLGDDGGVQKGTAAQSQAQQQGSAITVLLNLWAHHYNLIRDITGVNPARDGSMSPDSLVGVNQIAQMASNTTTKNLVDTAVYLNKKVNELISTRIGLIFKSKEASKIREMYENVISKKLLDGLEVVGDRHLHEFGFIFEMYPTSSEINEFKESLGLALQEQSIDVEIKLMTESIARNNMKLARKYLLYSRKKRNREKQQERMMFDQNKSQADAQSAVVAEQAKTKSYQDKKMVDFEYEKQMMSLRLQEASELLKINEQTKVKDFENQVYLKQIEAGATIQKNELVEGKKDDRIKEQATAQSKMIEQRNTNGSPIDFKNEENSGILEFLDE